MKQQIRLIAAGLAILALAVAQQPLDNSGIIKLANAGLGEEVMLSMINSQPGKYSTTPDDLVALKVAKVPDKVIAAMIAKGAAATPAETRVATAAPAAPVAAPSPYPDEVGVYFKRDDKYINIEPEILTMKTTGVLTRSFTYGIKSAKIKGWISTPHSRLRIGPSAEFLFRLPEGVSPAEYQILQLEAKDDRREVELGRARFNVSTSTHRSAINFEHERVGKSVYRIKVNVFKAGEYGFLPPGAQTSANAASVGKMYTFGVE